MVSTKKIWVFLCLVLFLAGCGGAGAASKVAKAPDGSGGSSNTTRDAPQGYPQQPGFASDSSREFAPPQATAAAEAPSPPSSASSARSTDKAQPREPSPDTRPGLGTEWGES